MLLSALDLFRKNNRNWIYHYNKGIYVILIPYLHFKTCQPILKLLFIHDVDMRIDKNGIIFCCLLNS